jgi:GNAT superfamily N-acetyltransferase
VSQVGEPPKLAMRDCRIAALGRENVQALAELFEAASCACYCRYWHFTGNKNEWLDRCAHRPEENRAELEAAVAGLDSTIPDPSADGLVALSDGVALGWMKLTVRAAVPKLRRLPVYRSLDLGDEGTTASVGCFLVRPTHRRQGVARALVAGAEDHARARGFRAIEAYPRRAAEPLYDEEAWQGPERIFVLQGWTPIHDVAPYPVYRKVLAR